MEEIENCKISIVVHASSDDANLRNCLASVANQKMPAIEVICLIDARAENSLAVSAEFRNKGLNIQVIKTLANDLGKTLNQSIAQSQGEYLHFLTTDCRLLGDCYELWYAFAKEHGVEVCASLAEEASGVSSLAASYFFPAGLEEYPEYFVTNENILNYLLFNKEFLLEHSVMFDELRFSSKLSFHYQALLQAERIYFIKECFIACGCRNKEKPAFNNKIEALNDNITAFRKISKITNFLNQAAKKVILNKLITEALASYHSLEATADNELLSEQIADFFSDLDLTVFSTEEIMSYPWYGEFIKLLPRADKTTKRRTLTPEEYHLDKGLIYFQQLKKEATEKEEWRKAYTDLLKKYQVKEQRLSDIESSNTWKLARWLTYPWRKIQEFGKKQKPAKLPKTKEERIIISLLACAAAGDELYATLQSLLEQSLKADLIILGLPLDHYPNKKASLPPKLQELEGNKLVIKYIEQYKGYNELLPELSEYQEDIIVTAKSGYKYPKNWLELLYQSYKKESALFIHCHEITKIFYCNSQWYFLRDNLFAYSQPSYLMQPSNKSGCLYPPKSLPSAVFTGEVNDELELDNADLWFWLMALKNNVKIKLVENTVVPICIDRLKRSDDAAKFDFTKQRALFLKVLDYFPELEAKLVEEQQLCHSIQEAEKVAMNKKNAAYYEKQEIAAYPAELLLWYHSQTKEHLNLDKPQTYHEKMQWLKLYDSTELKTRLADKYLVRQWVAEKIGEQHLIPLFGVWDSFEAIDFSLLPNEFYLKANHGCKWNIYVSDKATFDKAEAKKKFDIWLASNYAFRYGFQLHYYNIPPEIIAEQYLGDSNSWQEFKFFCCDGEPRFIQVYSYQEGKSQVHVFDLAWNYLADFLLAPASGKIPKKPALLEEIISLATILCQGFPTVRVDFYVLADKIYFGEMTFTSGSGIRSLTAAHYSRQMGNWINLPEPSEFKKLR